MAKALGDGNDTVITVKRSYDDQETFGLYTGAAVDGKAVPDSGSSAAQGSIILTLKADYLDTLSVGEHKVTISFRDGTAETAITIKDADSTPTPTPTPTPAPTPTPTPTPAPTPTQKPVPKTGDSADFLLWLGMILLGLAGMLIAGRGKEARKK